MPKKTLIDACKNGDIKQVKALLEKSYPNSRDNNGCAPLHFACYNGHIEVVRTLLLKNDIDINIADNDGSTPLHYACKLGHGEMVKLLLNKKADIKSADFYGLTPLHYLTSRFSKSKKPNYELVNLLLNENKTLPKDKQLNLLESDKEGRSIIYNAVASFGDENLTDHDRKELQTILKAILSHHPDSIDSNSLKDKHKIDAFSLAGDKYFGVIEGVLTKDRQAKWTAKSKADFWKTDASQKPSLSTPPPINFT